MSLRSAISTALLTVLRTADLRAFDEVPANRAFPYVSIGPVQIIPQDDGCSLGAETHLQLDIWSKDLSEGETGAIADQIRALLRTDLEIEGHTVVDQVLEDVKLLKDPAAQVAHGILSLRLDTEPA